MGSSRPSNSIRARKAPSVKLSPEVSSSESQRKPTQSPSIPPKSAAAVLGDMRRRLEVVSAVVSITHAALSGQTADADHDAAITLQRVVGDELDRQVEELGWVIAVCPTLKRTPIARERSADIQLAREARESQEVQS